MTDILNREPIKRNTFQDEPEKVIPPVNIIEPEVIIKKPALVSGTSKSDTISIPKSEWEAMKETVRLLEEGGTRKVPKVKDRVAKITLYEGKIVTKIVKTWIERKFGKINPREEDRLYANIETEDKAQYTVDFLDFLNEADRMICSIKKIEKKDASIVHGTFETQNLNPLNPLGENRDKNFRSEEATDLEEKTDDDYTLEITSGDRKGEKITLNHLALNL